MNKVESDKMKIADGTLMNETTEQPLRNNPGRHIERGIAMKDMFLTTKSGRKGRVIDIMNDDEILILLEFYDDMDPQIEWFGTADLAPCDHVENE